MAEKFTTNYQWTKPEVGASIDNWGGFLNADLDSIDNIVHRIDTTTVADAPDDSTTYGRRVTGGVGAWSHLTHFDIVDWVSAAAPPVSIGDAPPASPTIGSLWWDSVGAQLYVWFMDSNSSQWVAASNFGAALQGYLQLTGGTMTGPLSGPSGSFVNLSATNLSATNLSAPQAIGDNRIINGDMRIDQRNGGNSGTVTGYTIDRWVYTASQVPKGGWGRVTPGISGFPYYLGFTSSSAYASLAADYFAFNQPIEADMISDFAWGSAQAQPVTLSFWALSNLAGTHSGAIRNGTTPQRSYPFTFVLASNTWTKIVITIPGDTAGTWLLSGNLIGLFVRFNLGTGSTYLGPANAWGNGDYMGATGAVSVVGTNGGTFALTGVKLETGSVATPFNRQSLAKSMADCQRYYQIVAGSARHTAASGSINLACTVNFQTMRANPTFTLFAAGGRSNLISSTMNPQSINSGSFSIINSAAGDCYVFNDQWSLAAEL